MTSLIKRTFPTISDLVSSIEEGFVDSRIALPDGFAAAVPAMVQRKLTGMLVTMLMAGLPLLWLFLIAPYCYLVMTNTHPGTPMLPMWICGGALTAVTLLGPVVLPRIAPQYQLRTILVAFSVTVIPFSVSLVYYNHSLTMHAKLILLVLLAGVSSIIPSFVASHRRMFGVILCLMLPELVHFLFFEQEMPALWPLGPAIFIYLISLFIMYQLDNNRRKKAIITNLYLSNLTDRFSILNNAFSKANTQIKSAYEEENEIKQQQDGDYFLTASLLAPLSGGSINSDKFEVEQLVQAKTRFQFGGEDTQLGGDLNIIDTIELNGRRHILIVNADAMGKSMQGAGGALVLGTSLNRIVARTRSGTVQADSASAWIRATVGELHYIFSKFEGFMLISLVMGLIEEDTGEFFYINAEHPFCVYYDGSSADYIESDIDCYKIGSWLNGDFSKVRVKQVTLQPGCRLLIGSDGRDDLRENSTGEIHDDSNLLLQAVEKTKGNLPELYQELCRSGEPTDDLSLIAVHRKPLQT